MSRITFCKLTQAQYDAIETPNPETVYFLTDANAICLGSRTYVSREKADRFLVKRVFAHDTYGVVAYLDTNNTMELSGYFAEEISRIELWLVSANPDITGNVVLTLGFERFTVPVNATATRCSLSPSSPLSGRIAIARDTADPDDTLNDGTDAVTALVVDWRCY